MELFSAPWIEAFRRAADRPLGEAPAWTADLLFVTAGPEAPRRLFLRVDGGRLAVARAGTPDDEEAAVAVVAGPAAAWHAVLLGDLDPILALIQGELELRKGRLLRLLPHQGAARTLARVAARVPTEVPHGAEPSREPLPGRSTRRPLHPGLTTFPTLSGRGLDNEAFPMRLYHEAKRLGIWDPQSIDLTRDRMDWEELSGPERHILLRLAAFFQAGEEALTRDLLPLIQVIANAGRLEEEMYLTSFLFEQAKHVEVFRRFMGEVARDPGDLRRFETPAYRALFQEELPTALYALRGDASPRAQIRAAAAYNVIVEGLLAETGYYGYLTVLSTRGILPGMQQAVRLLRRDEGRHVAYGLYLISRLLRDDPGLWASVQSDLGRLLDPALALVAEMFEPYETVPFGLDGDLFTDHALQRFRLYLERLDRGRRRGALVEEPVGGGPGLLTAT